MIKRKNFLILILTLSSMAFATKYEAEAATLSGGAKNVNASAVSGTGYADLQEGNNTPISISLQVSSQAPPNGIPKVPSTNSKTHRKARKL